MRRHRYCVAHTLTGRYVYGGGMFLPIEIKTSYLGKSLVYSIPLEDEMNAYMRIDFGNECKDERYIVWVDSAKFLALCKQDPISAEPRILSETYEQDRKFHKAVKGFSHGQSNPVPLAKVVCKTKIVKKYEYKKRFLLPDKAIGFKEETLVYCGFIDGITRTMWLLSKCASFFPVHCRSNDGARLLYDNCGVGEFSSLQKLVDKYT